MHHSEPRNLFNADCNFFCADHMAPPASGGGEPYTFSIIADYIDMLHANGVDTYICNGNGQVPWYPSKAVAHILTGYRRGDLNFVAGHYPPCDETFPPEMLKKRCESCVAMLDRFLDMQDAGIDWFAEVPKHCRQIGMRPWASIRMNDAHGSNSWAGSYMNCPVQRDPSSRLEGRALSPADPPNRFEQLCNYADPRTRDYMLRMIHEVIDNYDYEGLELDWLRTPFCCNPPAKEEEIAALIAWHRKIRLLTNARARQTGRPYPLSVRIPPRLEIMRDLGLDFAAMAQAGIIDYVAVSNFWQTTWDVPYDELRAQLGPWVKLLGVIEAAPNWMHALDPQTNTDGYRLLPSSPPLMRGNAAGKLALGCAGIEWFNFFCADSASHQGWRNRQRSNDLSGFVHQQIASYPDLAGIHDLNFLRGKPKHYTLSTERGYFMFHALEYGEQIPTALEPAVTSGVPGAGSRKTFRLSMCAEPAAAQMELIVQIVVEKAAKTPELGVAFNGRWPSFDAQITDELLFPAGMYTHHIPRHLALNYRADPARIREGWNEVVVYNNAKSSAPVKIYSVEIAVRPRTP